MTQLPFPAEDYVLGLADLPGELVRFAINSLIAGDAMAPFAVRDFLYKLAISMDELPLRHGPVYEALEHKSGVLHSSIAKIDQGTLCL